MLNYTVPPFQFLVGTFDASQYLDSISLSVPMHEPRQPLLWSGQFKISNNLKAQSNGLTDNDFSEFGNPGRWRPYQQQVRLNIRGNLSPVFRIENYRYNAQTGSGEGTLTQIPTAVAGDRPSFSVEPSEVTSSINYDGRIVALNTVVRTLSFIILLLIKGAFTGCRITPGVLLLPDFGLLDVPLVTRDPWADACRLSGLNWNWLSVDSSESIISINGTSGSMLFSRSAIDVELTPDLAAIYQSASKIIVTGARQVEDKSKGEKSPATPRPKFKTTIEMRPIGSVFSSLDGDASPITFEEKTIIYQYWDDDSWSEHLPFGTFLTSFSNDIQSVTQSGIDIYSQAPPDLTVPLQTITIKRQPLGYVIPVLGNVFNLIDAEVLIESSIRKLTLKPIGTIFSSIGSNMSLSVSDRTKLVVEKKETLTSELIPTGAKIVPPGKNLDGKPKEYEKNPRPEPAQEIATRPLITQVLRGEANISPLNWVPILKKPLVVDFGFLPDAARAYFLAHKIAIREQQRRNQVLVEMPIPNEWLASGWQPLSRCTIGNDLYLMDGCAISINDGQAKFGFTGGLVGKGTTVVVNGVPTIVSQAQHQITTELEPLIVFEALISLSEASAAVGNIVFDSTVGSGILVDAIGTLLFDGVVVSSTGIIVASDIIYEASVSFGLMQRINFSVSPSSVLEGNPVIQTINFSVSPSSVLEG